MSFIHIWEPNESDKTLLVLHGTGGDEESLLSLARRVAPGWNYLSPRGRVDENGANRFFRRFSEGVFDVEDMKRQAADLGRFVAESAKTYAFDMSKVYALGYSNGANIASALILGSHGSGVSPVAGAVLIRAMVPYEPDISPALGGARILILNGAHDPLEPPGETDRLAAIYRSCGAEVDVRIIPAGHELTRMDIEAVSLWLASYV
jgi:phospholipase/carboxylesterase